LVARNISQPVYHADRVSTGNPSPAFMPELSVVDGCGVPLAGLVPPYG
jgi:hypothetical protein